MGGSATHYGFLLMYTWFNSTAWVPGIHMGNPDWTLGFGLAQLKLWWSFGKWTYRWKIYHFVFQIDTELRPWNSTHYISLRNANTCLHKSFCIFIHGSIIHNNQKIETTQFLSKEKLKDKVIYSYKYYTAINIMKYYYILQYR